MTDPTLITHGGPNRCYQICKCSKCNIVRECTPSFDFYTLDEDGDNGPLVCESCMRPIVSAAINKPVD